MEVVDGATGSDNFTPQDALSDLDKHKLAFSHVPVFTYTFNNRNIQHKCKDAVGITSVGYFHAKIDEWLF